MSRRYPDKVTCPHCGLTVAGKAETGETRAHGSKAVAAGFATAPCASSTNIGQRAEADQHRKESADRRAEYWARRQSDPTITEAGTAQPRRQS